MQSDDKLPRDTTTDQVALTPTHEPLRRETIMAPADSQRGAMVMALCSLTGVAMGFGLSQIASMNSHQAGHSCESRQAPSSASVVHVTPSPYVPQEAKYTWLGVEGASVSPHSAHSTSTKAISAGAAIHRVFQGSPAQAAGIRSGDVITSLGGTAIVDFPGLVATVRQHRKGEQLEIGFVRGSAEEQLTQVRLGDIARSQFRRINLRRQR